MNRVPEILAGLVPEFSDLPHEAKPVAKVALRRAVLRQSIWFGGGFWLAVFAVACMAGLAALVGGIESGAILLEEGDERLIGLLYTFCLLYTSRMRSSLRVSSAVRPRNSTVPAPMFNVTPL